MRRHIDVQADRRTLQKDGKIIRTDVSILIFINHTINVPLSYFDFCSLEEDDEVLYSLSKQIVFVDMGPDPHRKLGYGSWGGKPE